MELEDFPNPVDYSHHFQTKLTFKSGDEAKKWARDTARQHHMYLIVDSSRKRKIFITCERSRGYKPRKINLDVQRRRCTGTKKCECPFRLKAWEEGEGLWRVAVLNGYHNHNPGVYHHGHALASTLS